ncbi:tetratricopeptide repeat protein [Paractinoplanes lichenicola]|uniref:Tetratricopeptide repeat protein n=1 Tax=Paractinoplanes lichenicola TaxID=2802976 RepID=A0ABS1VV71_9ACTN|nr:tetratricopeptide repeat protein [Actinoplanes lichenicola]MBL7258380.1 tetratricopeptide repeat protein [Actinoplanes lichenicola]
MSPRTGEMLAAYFDLRSDRGPVHARIVGLMGRCLARGDPIPVCQTVTPSGLRYAISLDTPDRPMIDDPRSLPPAQRSPEWTRLCELIEDWDSLDLPDRLRVTRVLHKLGLWGVILRLAPPRPSSTSDDAAWRTLTRLRHMAALKARGEDDFPVPLDMYETYAQVARDPHAQLEERISAAVNLAAHHGRNDRTPDDIAPWAILAMRLLDDGSPSPLLASAAWRAICFLPYYRNDHLAVATMLDEAERLALIALRTADRLIAVENLRVLHQTRGRAARDPATAEDHYRRAVELDPDDPQTHVTLADHLLRQRRPDEAYEVFATAADLGAPYTGYSRSRMAQCRP